MTLHAADISLDQIDLSDMKFWAGSRDVREATFQVLRDTPDLQHFEEQVIDESPFPPGAGYYALTRHEDIWAVSRNATTFCSGHGSNIGDLPPDMNEFFGSMINMDDPKHFRLRSIVSKGFAPKEVTRVEGLVVEKAKVIVDRIQEQFPDKQCDFVEHIAAALPLEIICDMMGIPAEDYSKIFSWTNTILGVGDPDFVTSYDDLMIHSLEMFTYAQTLGEDRRAYPQHDITSVMMNAEVDGDQLTPQEFGSFFILLVVAGNETTRNAISHGMKALTDNPEQREILYGGYETHANGRRGDGSVCITGDPLPAHRHRRHRGQRFPHQGWREGRHVLQLRQSRRAGVRQSSSVRRSAADAAGPGRLWRWRPSLLPRGQPGTARNDGDVRRDTPSAARAADRR